MKIVVDASVAVKWFLDVRPGEQDVEKAESVAALLDQSGTELFAPVIWVPEVLAVLTRIDPEVVDDALLAMLDMNRTVIATPSALKTAADMSIRLRHHLFDTLYHAVALECDATLVTADQQYLENAAKFGNIVGLADFKA